MKQIVFKVFYNSVGKVIRYSQRSLLVRPREQDTLMWLIKQSAIKDSAQYAIENFSEALQFNDRKDLWQYCLTKVPKTKVSSGEGCVTEFGVWKGASINFFAKELPNIRIYGFDSFEGLEEDWYGFSIKKGTFNTNGVVPKVEKNVKLFSGWFEDTLPDFMKELKSERILLCHMDADTYKPTKYVLSTIANNLQKGPIIIFDEYFGYSSWRLHEHKAWREVSHDFNFNYKYIGYTGENHVAVEIL